MKSSRALNQDLYLLEEKMPRASSNTYLRRNKKKMEERKERKKKLEEKNENKNEEN